MSDRRTEQQIAALLALLDRTGDAVSIVPDDPELALLTELGRELKVTATANGSADPGFRASLRTPLLAAAASGNIGSAARSRRAALPETAVVTTEISPLLALYSGKTLHLLTTANVEGEERVRATAFQRFQRRAIPSSTVPAWLERKIAAA